MQTYNERSTQLALDSSIAVLVSVNTDGSDMDFWSLRPCVSRAADLPTPEEYAARQLRGVGVIGLCGSTLRFAFRECLHPDIVERLLSAFRTYVCNLVGVDITRAVEMAEVAELERLFDLPDTRQN